MPRIMIVVQNMIANDHLKWQMSANFQQIIVC